MKNICALVSCTLLLFEQHLNAQVGYFQGIISADTVLTADTIKVTGNIYVSDGVTLTIAKGVYMEFQGYYKIDVKGRLLAVGDINDTIIFIVKDTTGFTDTSIVNGSWAGMHFDNTPLSNDTSSISYCKIMYGKAIGDTLPDFAGGAVYVNNFSKIIISNSTICNNIAKEKGAGVYCGANSSPLINKCYFFNNKCYNEGGGIYIGSNSNARIFNNLFFRNMAYFIKEVPPPFYFIQGGSGGGIYSSSDSLNSYCPQIINNRFFNNIAISGGGVYESNYNITIMNNIICNNDEGGIFNGHQLGNGKYINNTIANNYLISSGGGITCFSSSVEIINSIIWGNLHLSDDSSQIKTGLNANPTVKYCNVQYKYPGEGNMDSFPLFVLPSDSPGVGFNGFTADWSLQNNSPCKNSGIQDTTGLNIPLTDVFGNPRIYGGRIDMGAIENQMPNSIEEIQLTDNLVYPNPFSDKLNVIQPSLKWKNIFELYDITGKIVYEKKLTDFHTTLDISFLMPGLFYYRITDRNEFFDSGKIIKQ